MKGFTLTEKAKLQCSCGSSLSELKVTSQAFSKIGGLLEATENDNKSGENIKPFGTCSQTKKSCIPEPLKWNDVESWNSIDGKGSLTDDSTLPCSLGGVISCKENGQYFHGMEESTVVQEKDYLSEWEEIVNRRRRGDSYILLKDGTLKKDEDMLQTTVDRIYAVKEDGTGDSFNSVDLEEMGQIEDTWEKNPTSYTDLNNNRIPATYYSFTVKMKEKAKEVFEFLALNSDVEFSYTQLDNLFIIGTSRLRTKVAGGRKVVTEKLYKTKEIEFIHSHPEIQGKYNEKEGLPDAPSGFNTKSGMPTNDGGDRNNAESKLRINPKSRFSVFSCLYTKREGFSVYIWYTDRKFDYAYAKKYYEDRGSETYYDYEI